MKSSHYITAIPSLQLIFESYGSRETAPLHGLKVSSSTAISEHIFLCTHKLILLQVLNKLQWNLSVVDTLGI